MNFALFEKMCTRALEFTFVKKKLLLTTLTLLLCGILIVFCMGLAIQTSFWLALSLSFLPVFISGGVLTGLGVILIRAYHNEIKFRDFRYTSLILESSEIVITSSYVFMPVVLLYLLMWMTLGLFFLLQEIPLIGQFFGVAFAFGPFLLNLGSIVLCLFSIYLLFVMTPLFALRKEPRMATFYLLIEEMRSHIFTRVVLLGFSLVPLLFSLTLLFLAAKMTTWGYMGTQSDLQMILQSLIIMVPFCCILSPSVVFFFSMAAETHVVLQKRIKPMEYISHQ